MYVTPSNAGFLPAAGRAGLNLQAVVTNFDPSATLIQMKGSL